MKVDCASVEDRVKSSLLSVLKVEPFDEGCEITLPVLDRLNDHLKVYVTREGSRHILTDLGTAIDQLKELGVDLSTQKQDAVFLSILRSNGIEFRRGMLCSEVDLTDSVEFGRRFRLFVHGISEIAEMETMGEPRIGLDFEEVVWDYLRVKRIPTTHKVPVDAHRVGRVVVNFLIGSRVLMDAAHAGDVGYANQILNRIIVDFESIQKVHARDYLFAVVYDDESPFAESPRFKLLPDLLNFAPIPWSEREERFDDIVAHSQA
jgi:hypothetical protein